jgi:hypothetical protein
MGVMYEVLMNALYGHRTCACTLKPHDVSKVTSVYSVTKFTTYCLLLISINQKLTQLHTLLYKLHICRVVIHKIMIRALPFAWLCFTKLARELTHVKGCAHRTGMGTGLYEVMAHQIGMRTCLYERLHLTKLSL